MKNKVNKEEEWETNDRLKVLINFVVKKFTKLPKEEKVRVFKLIKSPGDGFGCMTGGVYLMSIFLQNTAQITRFYNKPKGIEFCIHAGHITWYLHYLRLYFQINLQKNHQDVITIDSVDKGIE